MGMLGKLARGLATGYANYQGIVAQQQIEERKEAARSAREMALENLRSQNRKGELATAGEQQRLTDTNKEAAGAAAKAGLAPILAENEIKVNSAKESQAFATWLAKQPIELRNQLTLEDFRQDRQDGRTVLQENRQDGRAAADRGERVVGTGVDAQGNTVVMKGNDSIVRFKGVQPKPSGSGGGDDSVLGLAGEGAPTGGRGGGGMVPRPAGADYSDWDQLKSEIAMDPRFKDLPMPQKIAKARELAALGNITVRPGE